MTEREQQPWPVPDDEFFKNAPLRDLVMDLYMQTLQTQALILDVKKHTNRIEVLEDAISRIAYIKSRWVKLRYDHRLSELTIGGKFKMKFKSDSQEAALLDIIFTKKTKAPKKTRWQSAEVAESMKEHGINLDTQIKVTKALLRINERIKQETGIDGLIEVSSKQFFVVNTQ